MTPTTNPNLVVALYRCSTDRQTASGLGLDAQKADVEAYCERHGLQVVAEHADLGVSGKAPLDERTGLVSALADVVSYRAGGLIVAKLDRLSRDPLLAMTIERMVERSGSRVISASGEGTSNDDPSQVLMRRILAAVAENESSVCAARIKAALQVKRDRGELCGRPPFGFTTDGATDVLPADDAWMVVRAMELRQDKQPLRVVAKELGWPIDKAQRICAYWKRRGDLEEVMNRGHRDD